MAEVEDPQPQQPPPAPSQPELSEKLDKLNLSTTFSIWPPSQRTREAVINRLILTLSEPSILSKRYGSMPQEDASAIARAIEAEAFASAAAGSGDSDSAASPSIDEGIEILQIYSKEISKRMLDAVKSRAATPASDVSSLQSPAPDADPAENAASEEASSALNESSS